MECYSMVEKTNYLPVNITYTYLYTYTYLDHICLYLIFDTFPKGLVGIALELPSLQVCSQSLQLLLIFPRSFFGIAHVPID